MKYKMTIDRIVKWFECLSDKDQHECLLRLARKRHERITNQCVKDLQLGNFQPSEEPNENPFGVRCEWVKNPPYKAEARNQATNKDKKHDKDD